MSLAAKAGQRMIYVEQKPVDFAPLYAGCVS
jgi:hypothetical protein